MRCLIKKKRAQSAMEFLMTYGWAILVVLVIIGAIAYFGVLNPENQLTERCILPAGFACQDFSVNNEGITITLANNAGRDMQVNMLTFSGEATGMCSAIPSVGDTANGDKIGAKVLRNGGASSYPVEQCNYIDTGRNKNKYKMSLDYSWLDSTETSHLAEGELIAK